MARQVADVFTEVVVAPAYDADALEILREKKNLRLLVAADVPARGGVEIRPVSGGLLLQSIDQLDAAGRRPVDVDARLRRARRRGDAARPRVRLARGARGEVQRDPARPDGAAVGVGMGQVNRVDSCTLAVARAGDGRARGSVAASDAFFPFPDGLEVLLEAGVKAVVQPGGSVRDDEVIAAATAAGVTMYFTGHPPLLPLIR